MDEQSTSLSWTAGEASEGIHWVRFSDPQPAFPFKYSINGVEIEVAADGSVSGDVEAAQAELATLAGPTNTDTALLAVILRMEREARLPH